MIQVSVFDLLQSIDSPQARNLQKWLSEMFPRATDCTSIQMAIQLEKLFEMAVFENQVDTVHLLLQQGFSPNIRGDWGTTPLMWATCLNYPQIASLLKAYGINQQAKSFSGKVAQDFQHQQNKDLPEYQSIVTRRAQIHAQVVAGYLKPLNATASTTGEAPQSEKHQRQIDNGKGIDEVFKNMENSAKKTYQIDCIIE